MIIQNVVAVFRSYGTVDMLLTLVVLKNKKLNVWYKLRKHLLHVVITVVRNVGGFYLVVIIVNL